MEITTLPQALERIDLLETENLHLRRELGYVPDEGALARMHRRWSLTGKEAQVLLHLNTRRESFATKQSVMTALYDGRDEPEIKIVDVFVCKLRDKIGAAAIDTVWGQGYRLSAAGAAALDDLLAQPLAEVRPASRVDRERVQVEKGVRQARMLRVLCDSGPIDLFTLRSRLRPAFSRAEVANLVQGARQADRIKVADWRLDADGRRRSVYEITAEGRAYVAKHASALSEIPA